ncbi:MAG: hypothetical protein QM776_15210 [Rhodocyclaceae bacterium]
MEYMTLNEHPIGSDASRVLTLLADPAFSSPAVSNPSYALARDKIQHGTRLFQASLNDASILNVSESELTNMSVAFQNILLHLENFVADPQPGQLKAAGNLMDDMILRRMANAFPALHLGRGIQSATIDDLR